MYFDSGFPGRVNLSIYFRVFKHVCAPITAALVLKMLFNTLWEIMHNYKICKGDNSNLFGGRSFSKLGEQCWQECIIVFCWIIYNEMKS